MPFSRRWTALLSNLDHRGTAGEGSFPPAVSWTDGKTSLHSRRANAERQVKRGKPGERGYFDLQVADTGDNEARPS